MRESIGRVLPMQRLVQCLLSSFPAEICHPAQRQEVQWNRFGVILNDIGKETFRQNLFDGIKDFFASADITKRSAPHQSCPCLRPATAVQQDFPDQEDAAVPFSSEWFTGLSSGLSGNVWMRKQSFGTNRDGPLFLSESFRLLFERGSLPGKGRWIAEQSAFLVEERDFLW